MSGRVYDLRTQEHLTLKQKPVRRPDFHEFVQCFKPGAIHERMATWSEKNPEGRWRSFGYNELAERDKLSLDLFWFNDESLEDSNSLPEPDMLA